MHAKTLKADFLLLLTALIWGLAFVAQRTGMEHMGPHTFNGVRFALGGLVLVPVILRQRKYGPSSVEVISRTTRLTYVWGGAMAGVFLFTAAGLQQMGLVHTTAGKAGFITGLYVVLVPILGLAFRLRPSWGVWIGAFLAATGMYFLSVTEAFTISKGDVLELIGALFWAGHMLAIGWLSPRMDALKLAVAQYFVCSILSLIAAVLFESITLAAIWEGIWAILYCGLLSVGVAYTLQVIAQRDAQASHAAIILSLEAVFAALAGWVLLSEELSLRALMGCGLMLTGMLLAQLWPAKEKARQQAAP